MTSHERRSNSFTESPTVRDASLHSEMSSRSSSSRLQTNFIEPSSHSNNTVIPFLNNESHAADDYRRDSLISSQVDARRPALSQDKIESLKTRSFKNLSEQRVSKLNRIKSPNSVQATLTYHGTNIYTAALQGNFPVFVLLWGIAAGQRIDLLVPDSTGNNPLHYAVLSNTCDVSRVALSV